ncbi:MAG TPA: hypothetical protein VK976_15435 [Verrucomicrobiae bacterium]|jgi:hypothetical protein|nr:hypothetical protein [Verrucomicrobiae bacterium]
MKHQTIDATVEPEEVVGLRQKVTTLVDEVSRLEQQLAAQSKALNDLMAKLADTKAAESAKHAIRESVNPDVLLIITAAISSFLGKKIRIRSARMLQSPYEIVNPWSQQGRVSVQASHSLRWER